jgi:hypothetical protein
MYVLLIPYQHTRVPFATLQRAVVKSLQGSFIGLARHKFGSNVVEKLISSGGGEDAPAGAFNAVMEEILAPEGLEALLDDPFANYVVQGAIKHCAVDGNFLMQLRDRIAAFDRGHHGWVRDNYTSYLSVWLCPGSLLCRLAWLVLTANSPRRVRVSPDVAYCKS